MQRDGFTAILLDLDDLLGSHVEFLRQFLGGGFTTQVLQHLALDTGKLVNDLDHVHGDADRASLVSHRSGDRLTNPPRGVGRELVPLRVVKLFDRANKTEVALLNEVQELHAATGVALSQRHDQTQVGLEQVVLRLLTILGQEVQLATLAAGHLVGLVLQLVLGVQASLNAAGQVDFLLGVQQGDLADLLEVVLHRVGGRASDRHLLDGLVGLVGVGDDESTLDVNAGVRAFAQRSTLGCLRLFLLRLLFALGHILVVGIGVQVRILKVLARGIKVFFFRDLEIRRHLLDNLRVLLLATARFLGGGLLLLGTLRCLLRGLLGSGLLRGSLLRGGLLGGGLLLLGARGCLSLRSRRGLPGARRLLREGFHLRGVLSRRGVLCRSARCTHTGPFH